MTMQVGMVGTDGVLIASDTKWMDRSGAVWNTYDTSKIIVSDEKGIAVSQALCMETATALAKEIIAAGDWQSMAYEIGQKVLGSVIEEKRKDAHCFIASRWPSPQLFSLRSAKISGKWGVVSDLIETKKIAGDKENPAVFWAERYYPHRPKVPIRNLAPFAAHLVVSAALLHPAGIGGLEILLCDTAGFHRLSEDSIHELQAKAEGWDKHFGDLILGCC